MTTAEKYDLKGKKKKAQKYMNLAADYEYQKEWMAYKEIPTALIKQATHYPRTLVNQNKEGDVIRNDRYVEADTVASQKAFPESKKGCPNRLWQLMKTCLLSKKKKDKTSFGRWSY